MKYLVFYDIVRLGDAVAAEDAIEAELTKVTSDLLPVLKEHGEFFGLIDDSGTTLQVAYRDDHDPPYWMEIPNPRLGGSFGTYIDWESIYELLSSVGPKFPEDGYPGFNFQSWR